jgi:hypothetical protein
MQLRANAFDSSFLTISNPISYPELHYTNEFKAYQSLPDRFIAFLKLCDNTYTREG